MSQHPPLTEREPSTREDRTNYAIANEQLIEDRRRREAEERDTRQPASGLPPGSSTTPGDESRHEQARDENASPSTSNQLIEGRATGRDLSLDITKKSKKMLRNASDLGARGVHAGLTGPSSSVPSTQLSSTALSTASTPSGHAAQTDDKIMLLKRKFPQNSVWECLQALETSKWDLDDAGEVLASLASGGVELPVEEGASDLGAGRAGPDQNLGPVDRADDGDPQRATPSVSGLEEEEMDSRVGDDRWEVRLDRAGLEEVAKQALGEMERRGGREGGDSE